VETSSPARNACFQRVGLGNVCTIVRPASRARTAAAAVVRALINRPGFAPGDEPTGALDLASATVSVNCSLS